jgi:hypothetical protein
MKSEVGLDLHSLDSCSPLEDKSLLLLWLGLLLGISWPRISWWKVRD